MKVFFDTNVLVYMFDADAPAKQKKARSLFKTHTEAGDILLSTQVLQEFYVTVTRKLARPLSAEQASGTMTALAELPGVPVDNQLVLAAVRRSQASKLSFWDSLIVESALHGGAAVLYSEDMQHGQKLGSLKIENPF